MSSDITVMILREIRDEVRLTRIDLAARIDTTNHRIDALSDRLDGIHANLSARLDAHDARFDAQDARFYAKLDQLRDETRAAFAAVLQLMVRPTVASTVA
jgi:hypothetical protein